MSQSIAPVSEVKSDNAVPCPRCEGKGRVRFSRVGGWLVESCSVCRGACRVDPETAETVRTLQRHADAALGPVDGPCCSPEEGGDLCVSCVPPDLFPDEPFVPSEADEADYRAWCREHHDRQWNERIAADEDAAWRDQCRREDDARLVAGILVALQADTFQEMLAGFANSLTDHGRADVRWTGVLFGTAYDQARFFGATSGESFDDRKAACLDAEAARIEARMAAHAGR